MELFLKDITQLPDLAKQFIEQFAQKSCFAFYAEMGAGKTTFIMALLKAMGIGVTDGSPTYSLVNVYDSPAYGKIFHFDLYRLKDENEAYAIGIEEMLYGSGLCFIEWPEKIVQLLPENTVSIYIRRNQDNSRTIKIQE